LLRRLTGWSQPGVLRGRVGHSAKTTFRRANKVFGHGACERAGGRCSYLTLGAAAYHLHTIGPTGTIRGFESAGRGRSCWRRWSAALPRDGPELWFQSDRGPRRAHLASFYVHFSAVSGWSGRWKEPAGAGRAIRL